jgi:hypothetical protein
MQLFDFGLIVLSLTDLVGKKARQAINRLSLPRRYLRGMDLVLGRNLLRRLISTQRLKRYCGQKLVRKTASLRHLCILSSLLDTS